MIEASSIGSLNHMVLFIGPFKGAISTNDVMEFALSLPRNFKAYDSLPALGFEMSDSFGGISDKCTVIDKRLTVRFCRGSLGG
jgi:hypothetical protein